MDEYVDKLRTALVREGWDAPFTLLDAEVDEVSDMNDDSLRRALREAGGVPSRSYT